MPTETFTADADFTVPEGVFSIEIELEGEAGVTVAGKGNGGDGGTVRGILPVRPGDTLYIRDSPGGAGGFNNDGGDSIDVRKNGTALSDRVAVAAGGGGGADWETGATRTGDGGDGGANVGREAQDLEFGADTDNPATGGSQVNGGIGSELTSGVNGQDGSLGAGGDGGASEADGGGGGAGLYGGGGGAGGDTGGTGDAGAFAGAGGSNYARGFASIFENTRGTSNRSAGQGGQATFDYFVSIPSLNVSNPTDTTTDLSWSINLSPEVSSLDQWQLYRDTDTGTDRADYTQIATYPPGTTSDTDTGLDMGTTYHYRIDADVTAPTLDVETLSATNVEATTVDLTGDLVSLADAASADVQFEYIGSDQSSWTETPIQTLDSPQTFSESVTGLDPETEYVARAVGEADGARDVGGVVTWTTPEGGAIPDSATWQIDLQKETGFSDGDSMSSLTDHVGSNDATGSGTYRASAINGYPAVELDGVEDEFTATAGQVDPWTIYCVVNIQTDELAQVFGQSDEDFPTVYINNSDWIGTDDTGNTTGRITTESVTNAALITYRGDPNASNIWRLRVNGVEDLSNEASYQIMDVLHLGSRAASNDRYMDGYLGFAESHNGDVSNGILTREQEIANKWDITLA